MGKIKNARVAGMSSCPRSITQEHVLMSARQDGDAG